MSLADDVDLDEFVMTKDDLSGADIKVSPSLPPSLHLYLSLYIYIYMYIYTYMYTCIHT